MIGSARRALVFSLLMGFCISGLIVAGTAAAFFWFEELTGSRTLAACSLGGSFLAMALLTLIGYKAVEK